MTEGTPEWGRFNFLQRWRGRKGRASGHQERFHGDRALKKSVGGGEKPLKKDHTNRICKVRKTNGQW